MSNQTIIYGYIEINSENVSSFIDLIQTFEFDSVYPFPNVFSPPVISFRSAMVSFALSLKMTPDEWHEWTSKFEIFISRVNGISAKAVLESETSSETIAIDYIFSDEKWNSIRSRVVFEKEDGLTI